MNKIGDRIFTPRGYGVVRMIEDIYDESRYCVELEEPDAGHWIPGNLCCYFESELDMYEPCHNCEYALRFRRVLGVQACEPWDLCVKRDPMEFMDVFGRELEAE